MGNRFSATVNPEYYGPSGMEVADTIGNAMAYIDQTQNRNARQKVDDAHWDKTNARADVYAGYAGDENRRRQLEEDIQNYLSGWRPGDGPPIDPGMTAPKDHSIWNSGNTDPGFTGPRNQSDVERDSGVPEAALAALNGGQGSGSAPPGLDQMPQAPQDPLATPKGRMTVLGQQHYPRVGAGYIDPSQTAEARTGRSVDAANSEWDRRHTIGETDWTNHDKIDFQQQRDLESERQRNAREIERMRQAGLNGRDNGSGGSGARGGTFPGSNVIDPGNPVTLDKGISALDRSIDDSRGRATLEANSDQGTDAPAYASAIAQIDSMTARRDTLQRARMGDLNMQGVLRKQGDPSGLRAEPFKKRLSELQQKRAQLLQAGYPQSTVERAYNEDVNRASHEFGVAQGQ